MTRGNVISRLGLPTKDLCVPLVASVLSFANWALDELLADGRTTENGISPDDLGQRWPAAQLGLGRTGVYHAGAAEVTRAPRGQRPRSCRLLRAEDYFRPFGASGH
jgi:hypothetical protein